MGGGKGERVSASSVYGSFILLGGNTVCHVFFFFFGNGLLLYRSCVSSPLRARQTFSEMFSSAFGHVYIDRLTPSPAVGRGPLTARPCRPGCEGPSGPRRGFNRHFPDDRRRPSSFHAFFVGHLPVFFGENVRLNRLPIFKTWLPPYH